MADFIDYYKTLGVAKDADEKAIKQAFRKLARKFHPDVNTGDAEAERKFKEINEANAVLSDPEKRKQYDKYGKDWEHAEAFEKAGGQGQPGGGFRGGNPFGGGQSYTYTSGGGEDFSDFFSQMFGGAGGGDFGGGGFAGGRRPSFRGQDIQASLGLQMEDILEDNKQVLNVNGRQLRVTIPAGVEDGQTLRLRGQGGAGAGGGPAGDLLISFKVILPENYTRSGADLYKTQQVALTTMVLGGKITVETPSGAVSVPIPELSQNGKRIRLKGKGLPAYKKPGKGDLYLDLQAILPISLTEQERQLYQQLAGGQG